MSDAFQLFPVHDHSTKWKRALEVGAAICPGKDPEDNRCTCPDLVYATRVRLKDGRTFYSYLYCGCCDLPLTGPSGLGGLAKGEGPGGQAPRPDGG